MNHPPPPPIALDLVLIGGGHAHVHVLKMLGMNRDRLKAAAAGVQITVITSHCHTPYSGMLPGYLAGHYTYDDIHLDIHQLARFAGARFIHATACRITYNNNNNNNNDTTVVIGSGGNGSGGSGNGGSGGGLVYTSDGRPPIRYDCLSIDIGSAPLLLRAPVAGATAAVADDDVGMDTTATTTTTTSVVVPVKPIADFCQHYDAIVRDYSSTKQQQKDHSNPPLLVPKKYSIAVVGGGAGGIELALSLQYRLLLHNRNNNCTTTNNNRENLEVILVTRGSVIMETHNANVQKLFQRILRERNITVYYNAEVETVVDHVDDDEDSTTSLSSCASPPKKKKKRLVFTKASAAKHHHPQQQLPVVIVDVCLWCVTAGASEWLQTSTPFTVTEVGNFLRVHDTYELIHHPGVFAAGDCCHMDQHPRPKAGVFAVRAGPVLKDNLVNYLTGRPLIHHKPQATFLGLISTGDQYAVASRGRWFCLAGAWLWKIKDYIDRRWMAQYSTNLPDLQEMMAQQQQRHRVVRNASSGKATTVSRLLTSKGVDVVDAFTLKNPMRCGGCGAKVGSTTLSRVLRAVQERQMIRAANLGYEPPLPIDHDDAAITVLPAHHGGGGSIIQSMDYFREIVSDPFTFGKIVAVHALSDIHAMGASAQTALTLAVVPFAADEAITESTLRHLLSGVSDVLQDEGVRLVGGHTCEGLELACGLSVQGFTEHPEQLLRKSGGQIGDKIVLTKALGTGALFAADMRAKSRGEYVQRALDGMLQSSYKASVVARECDGVHACTDVTGFGLVGHLLEMLMANEGKDNLDSIGAVLDIRSIKFYQGGLEASANGIFSSLQTQNARNRRAVVNHVEAADAFPVEYPLLFDPQTAGGLLFFVDPMKCDAFIALLTAVNVNATAIGELAAYQRSSQTGPGAEAPLCTIDSGDAATGLRVRITL